MMCLLSHCLATAITSGSTVLALGHYWREQTHGKVTS
jgi:hypothetical protein